jgi:replicative DNA helicase
MEDLHQLPQSIEAEAAVLGCILNNSASIGEIVGFLRPEDFYRKSHSDIFRCMVKMFSNDINVDLITTVEELRKENLLLDTGGITYLSSLAASAGMGYIIKDYANIVKEKAQKRVIIATAKEMITKSYDSGSITKDIINYAEDSIFNIAENKDSRMCDIVEAVGKTLDNIQNVYSNGGGLLGVSSGFKSLDKQLNGLQKGDFTILAARPSMGKTAFALNIAMNAGKKAKVALFSLEMSEEQLTQRMLSAMTAIDLMRLRSGLLNEKEWCSLAELSPLLATRDIKIDDTAGTTVNEIKAKCKKLKIKEGLDVVIIDYLQLIEGNGQSREQEISKISRSLKTMAKELNITVIALSQLSRACEARPNHRPVLSDLRESGAIEQDADTVLFLYRDEYYNADSEDKNIAECIIAKNRNGQVGTIKLAWVGHIQRFGNLDIIH